ncbi:hypothetical protein [Psychromicrobium lacuslunae]|uniref:Uncharacterized protein n=1 Tax=Psychromicrobium lacuslunae TaxID=1618207 RepID=A0A0D4BX05_9MICC|nr:hypothetical protein [Psychromicrobium lacuslunae]AJT40636.1 hypothetical protein UM93_02165 [Psychromicrobium lacuslunae]
MKTLKKLASLGAGVSLLGLALFASGPAQAAVVCGSEPLSTSQSAEATPMCGATDPSHSQWVCPARDSSIKVWVSTPRCP